MEYKRKFVIGGGASRSAYTLAEVVIVMLVVAVIVGVSIKITKAKLDNIVSYTYYSGFSTLRSVTKQVVADFNPNKNEYMEVGLNQKLNLLDRLFASPAYAKNCYYEYGYDSGDKKYSVCLNYTLVDPCVIKDWNCNAHIGEYGITAELCQRGQFVPYGRWLTKGILDPGEGNTMYLLNKLIKDGVLRKHGDMAAYMSDGSVPVCSQFSGGTSFMGLMGCHDVDASQHCDWKNSGDFENVYQVIVSSETTVSKAPPECTVPSEQEKDTQYCQGKEFDQTTCSWKNITPWPPCGNNKGTHWSQNSCACVPEPPTPPRKGQNFCEKFVSYANTKSNSSECTGDAIPSDLTDFSDKTADITLRNGMRIYNIRQNPAPIQVLDNNIQGASYDGVDNVNEYGYTVYLDIDGEKGPSTLWQDVYPFYITMSGTVIPAYNMTVGSEETGGNSRHHLMTSIEKESVDATGHRKLYWISKSVSYKEGACSAGYIGASTAYCHGVPLKASCSGTDGTCILKYVSPVKFFQ